MSRVKEEYPRKARIDQRVYHYAYDYNAKVWRPVACDADGNLNAVE